jgi:hypothetical protein
VLSSFIGCECENPETTRKERKNKVCSGALGVYYLLLFRPERTRTQRTPSPNL